MHGQSSEFIKLVHAEDKHTEKSVGLEFLWLNCREIARQTVVVRTLVGKSGGGNHTGWWGQGTIA